MPGAREHAARILASIEKEGSYSNLELKNLPSGISGADRALVHALVKGVLKSRMLLDYYIGQVSSVSAEKMFPMVRAAIRCGVYQLMFMDRIPASAACNETVNIVKKYANPGAAGLANAVMRAIARRRGELRPPPENPDTIGYLSVLYSYPEWIVRSWVDRFGTDFAKALLEAGNAEPPLEIRANTLAISPAKLCVVLAEEGVEASEGGVPGLLSIKTAGAIESLESFRRGLYHVQDAASQLCCLLLEPKEGHTVVDLCAAPGGKSFTVAEMMSGRGRVLSCDLHPGRLGLIREGAKRLGLSAIVQPMLSDATVRREEFLSLADRVLCDAPCSGLGIVRRKPEIRYKPRQALEELPQLQSAILDNAAAYVKPGGRLVYSTCTIRREENEDVAESFLLRNRNFELVDPDRLLPKQYSSGGPYMRLYPNLHGCDGFFAAVFEKKGA